MRVVICGGGVIGACTAYFLSRRGIEAIVVESTAVAAAASGKAGGFLALDWCAGSPLDALARRSFGLHAALRGEIEGDWGYQRTTAWSGFVVPDRDARREKPSRLDWLSAGIVIAQRLGTTETTAMLHPGKFTAAMMQAAQQHGAELRRGRVTGLVRDADGSTVAGVEPTAASSRRMRSSSRSGRGRCSRPVGWSCRPCSGGEVRASSTTSAKMSRRMRCSSNIRTRAVSLTIEVFPRADGSTHIVAFGDERPLPLDPAAVAPDPGEIDRLRAICERLSPLFRPEKIIARQACFRR